MKTLILMMAVLLAPVSVQAEKKHDVVICTTQLDCNAWGPKWGSCGYALKEGAVEGDAYPFRDVGVCRGGYYGYPEREKHDTQCTLDSDCGTEEICYQFGGMAGFCIYPKKEKKATE